jgi:hypothetical protein
MTHKLVVDLFARLRADIDEWESPDRHKPREPAVIDLRAPMTLSPELHALLHHEPTVDVECPGQN